MGVYLYGFDWVTYAGHVMPAFARWLIDGDETVIYQLFEQTRCAREEQFLPAPIQPLGIWTRAQTFIATLPRGPHSRREYSKLCSAEHFTALSDHYVYRYAPQLYQHSDAVRSIWGALIEEYCLPWYDIPEGEENMAFDAETAANDVVQSEQVVRSELLSLLHAAGLGELAKEFGEQGTQVERFDWEPNSSDIEDTAEVGIDEGKKVSSAADSKSAGIFLGHSPNTLQLRGWLASISLRAMVLFEYLACGRRSMPFGYEAAEPFGFYIGYLTPDEVWQLVTCLQDVTPPTQIEAEEDYLSFRHQLVSVPGAIRLIDEVLPARAADFLRAVRMAALQGLGLICSIE